MDFIVHWGCKSETNLSNFRFHFISFFFPLFCSIAVISTILSFLLSHHSQFSTLLPVILLQISSSAFFIPIIILFITVQLFSSSKSLLNIYFIFSIHASILLIYASILLPRFWFIFTIIPLNSFSRISFFIFMCLVLWVFTMFLHLMHVSLFLFWFFSILLIVFGVSFLKAVRPQVLLILKSAPLSGF